MFIHCELETHSLVQNYDCYYARPSSVCSSHSCKPFVTSHVQGVFRHHQIGMALTLIKLFLPIALYKASCCQNCSLLVYIYSPALEVNTSFMWALVFLWLPGTSRLPQTTRSYLTVFCGLPGLNGFVCTNILFNRSSLADVPVSHSWLLCSDHEVL